MRIISDQHDYYDDVQAFGQDRNVLYLRHERTTPLDVFPFPLLMDVVPPGTSITFRQRVVGFCGRVYAVLCVQQRRYGSTLEPDPEKWCYSLADVDTFIDDHCSLKQKIAYQKRTTIRCWPWGCHRHELATFFDEFAAQQDRHDRLFLDASAPVFVVKPLRKLSTLRVVTPTPRHPRLIARQGEISYNVVLKTLDFMRIIDTHAAFQAIAQYLSGPLVAPPKPMPTLADEVMAEIKGFDRHSFRKDAVRVR